MDTNTQLKNWKDLQEDITALETSQYDQEDLEFLNQPLNNLLFHEALDRTAMAGKIVFDMLYDHPVYYQHKELNAKLDKVLELLAELYLEIPNLVDYE
jgi:hypothetical protein